MKIRTFYKDYKCLCCGRLGLYHITHRENDKMVQANFECEHCNTEWGIASEMVKDQIVQKLWKKPL